MTGRGCSHHTIPDCGCTLRAMVAVSDEGGLQALICTENAGSRAVLCPSCQQVCQSLNATLTAQNFAQAAALRPGHWTQGPHSERQLESVLACLHEAMVEAVFDFEQMNLAEWTFQPAETGLVGSAC